jgi:hypothetical protein
MSSGNDKSAGETSHDKEEEEEEVVVVEEEEEEDVNEIRDNDDDVFVVSEQEGRRMAIAWVGCGYGEEILLASYSIFNTKHIYGRRMVYH